MPRPNYVLAWNNLKDILVTLGSGGIKAISPDTLLRLMVVLEHEPIDWNNLDPLLEALETPSKE